MIDFLFFDLGNVLVKFDHERACRQVAALSGLRPHRVRDIIFGGDLQTKYETGELTTLDFCREFNRRAGVQLDPNQLIQATSDIFWLNESIWPLIDRLQWKGCQLGVLSNTCDAHWQFVTKRLLNGMLKPFSEFVLSFEVGVAKPDPRIYDQAAARAGVAPERIFFTDDRLENVEAARQAGWQSHLFVSAEETETVLATLGVCL